MERWGGGGWVREITVDLIINANPFLFCDAVFDSFGNETSRMDSKLKIEGIRWNFRDYPTSEVTGQFGVCFEENKPTEMTVLDKDQFLQLTFDLSIQLVQVARIVFFFPFSILLSIYLFIWKGEGMVSIDSIAN